jgi:hypothetical protein
MALLLVALFAFQMGGDPSRDFLLTEKDAVLLGPAEAVSGPQADGFKWSSDGRFIAVRRTVMDVKALAALATNPTADPGGAVQPLVELSIWQVATRSSKKVFSAPLRETSVRDYGWLAGTGTLYAQTDSPAGHSDLWLASATSPAKKVASSEVRGGIDAIPSPVSPAIAIYTLAPDGNGTGTLSFLDASGRLSGAVPVPARVGLFRWSIDGSTLLARNFNKGAEGWVSISREGKWERVEEPQLEPTQPEKELSASNFRGEIGQKPLTEVIKVPTAILHATKYDPKDFSFAVIGTDAEKPALSPDQSSVAYVSQGVVMVRPLIRVSKEAFMRAREAAARTEIMNRAKQAGLALIMFASDNDDNYPSQDGWQDKVMPYLKNRDIISGFNYTYGGGDLSAIKEPANTVLGFITGPGGRAVTYADGHVKWEKNP